MVRKAVWALICLLIAPVLKSQQQSSSSSLSPSIFTRIYGPQDSDIPLPVIGSATGQKDASALQAMIDYLNAVGVTSWAGMQATGTYSQSNGLSGTASLSIGTSDQFRLDLSTSSGTRSTRIDGNFGMMVEADASQFPIPPYAAKIGIVGFARLFSPDVGTTASAIIDQGLVSIAGVSLHRITVEEAVLVNAVPIGSGTPSVTDFYFDPSSHLLKISTAFVQLNSTDRGRYLVVVRYDGYQSAGTLSLPHSIQQTINGQPQWALNLTDIALNPVFDPSYFQF